MTEQRFGQIMLGGKSYRIDIASFKGRDVVDFSPRVSVPGSGAIYNELSLYQPLMLSDWSAGFGYQWHTNESGYLRTDGWVDARHLGVAMLNTVYTESDSDQAPKYGFLSGHLDTDEVWAWTNSGIRKFSDTGWDNADPDSTAASINTMWFNGKYVFAAVSDTLIYYTTLPQDTSTWTATTCGDSSVDFNWLHHHDGYVYAGKDADSTGEHGNEIFFSNSIVLGDLYGSVNDDTNAIYCGVDGWETLGAITYQSGLFFPRADGLYQMKSDKSGVFKVLDFSDQASASNFSTWAVYNGTLYFPIRDTVYRWNGVSLAPITPARLTDSFPYTCYGSFGNFVVIGEYLWCTAYSEPGDGTGYDVDLLCFDGADWHQMGRLLTHSTTTDAGTVSAMYFDPLRNYLWISYYDGVNTTYGTRYIQFNSNNPFPYPNFPTTGTHDVITSRIDCGFRRVTKSTPSMLIEGSNLGSATYLLIYYSVDGGTWTAWGGEDTVTNKISTTGITELSNPLGWSPSTLEYKYIQIQVKFVTTSATSTPVLEGLTLRVLMRPDVKYGYSFNIVAAKSAESGLAQDSRTPRAILDDLEEARDSKSPIVFIDPFGGEHHGYVSAVNEMAIEEHTEDLGEPNIEHRVALSFVEV